MESCRYIVTHLKTWVYILIFFSNSSDRFINEANYRFEVLMAGMSMLVFVVMPCGLPEC